MERHEPVEIAAWSPAWAEEFARTGGLIRAALGARALRIDHIGSTAIAGLAAKPIVDIQVSVAGFEPMAPLAAAMAAIGFDWRRDNPDLSKRYFREFPGARRTHIHVCVHGSWREQWALLFRDYLRAHAAEQAAYVDLKRALAARHRDDRAAYTEGKADFQWAMIRRADAWAQRTGWRPGPSDG